MESESSKEVKKISKTLIKRKEEHWKAVQDSFTIKDFDSMFINLAKMNVLNRKLEMCETMLPRFL